MNLHLVAKMVNYWRQVGILGKLPLLSLWLFIYTSLFSSVGRRVIVLQITVTRLIHSKRLSASALSGYQIFAPCLSSLVPSLSSCSFNLAPKAPLWNTQFSSKGQLSHSPPNCSATLHLWIMQRLPAFSLQLAFSSSKGPAKSYGKFKISPVFHQ